MKYRPISRTRMNSIPRIASERRAREQATCNCAATTTGSVDDPLIEKSTYPCECSASTSCGCHKTASATFDSSWMVKVSKIFSTHRKVALRRLSVPAANHPTFVVSVCLLLFFGMLAERETKVLGHRSKGRDSIQKTGVPCLVTFFRDTNHGTMLHGSSFLSMLPWPDRAQMGCVNRRTQPAISKNSPPFVKGQRSVPKQTITEQRASWHGQ